MVNRVRMDATESPCYLRFMNDPDHSSYSQDKLNKINSDFIKDHQKLQGVVQITTFYFGNFIQNIRSKKWEEAEEYRTGALNECEKILNLLVTNGLQSEHEKKQDRQYANYTHMVQSSTTAMQGQTPLESNVREPKIGHQKGKASESMKTETGKRKTEKKEMPRHIVKENLTTIKETARQGNTGKSLVHTKMGISKENKQFPINAQNQKTRRGEEQISNSKQTPETVKKNNRSGKTEMVPNYAGNANKTATKRTTLPGNTGDNMMQNKHKNIQINSKKQETRHDKKTNYKPEQTPGIVMKHSRFVKAEMAPNAPENIHRTAIKENVQNSNVHYTIMESHVSHKDISSGTLEAKSSVAADSHIIRRSEEASLLLYQGNPNITDLSDSNRPIKLAERFSELYSNEYTDAFEELEMKQISERDIIQILLNIVTNAYNYCQRKAKDELTRLQAEVERDLKKEAYRSENVESLWKGLVAKGLKESGLKIKWNICQNFIGEELPKILRAPTLPIEKKLSNYANSSVEIVWLMCIQDPPLSMKWTEEKNNKKEFDTDLYRFYTKSGNYVEYYVWPVLRLYDGGPILTKGIAQGK